MTYSIFFAIVLILVSGFVAYFGDILGRRMGKKRLTLFGLRPRYTAIVITTITGMVIAGFALSTLIAVNPTFSKVFNEGEQILRRNQKLTTSNAQLEKRNHQLVVRSEQLEKEVAERRKEVQAAKLDVQKALQARDAALKAKTEAVKARDVATRSIARLEKDIAARQLELADLRKRNAAAEKDIKARVAELKSLQTKLTTAQASLQTAEHDLMVAEGDLVTANTNLTDTRKQLADAQKAFDLQQENLRAQQAALVQLSKDNVKLEQDSVKATIAKLNFEQQVSALRSGDLVFRQGEELARGVIPAGKSEFGVRGELIQLLENAGDKVAETGGVRTSEDRLVTLVGRFRDPDTGEIIPKGESDCLRMAVTAIMGQFDDALVQVVCAGNVMAGEKVSVEFKLYINNLVFREGRLIAVTKLDGTLSEGRLLLAVIDFLRKDVSQAALRAGIIPVTNPNPAENLGRDPASQVEALMALVDQIQAANSRVRVEAYTNEAVYAAGPLSMDNMRFVVKKLE